MSTTTCSSSAMKSSLNETNIGNSKSSLIILLVIFVSSLISLIYVYMNFPELDETEKQFIKIPFDMETAKELGMVLDRYKELYFNEVLVGIVLLYVFLQTFAIPGSLFLSILSGFLFNFPTAMILVCTCSALGATLCYLLSQILGRRVVKHYFPERAAKWAEQVDKHRHNLLSYMLFLRMTPFLPNWFINLVAPVIGVPLFPFVFGTFFGVAPPSILAIQAGKTLHTLTSSRDAISYSSVFLLTAFSFLTLAPIIFKKYFKKKVE